MKIFNDIANAITDNDVLMMEISSDENGNTSVVHSLDGIPLDTVNVMKYNVMGNEYDQDHKNVIVVNSNFKGSK
jgi:hypothetical protein